jgi:hypothetical protein
MAEPSARRVLNVALFLSLCLAVHAVGAQPAGAAPAPAQAGAAAQCGWVRDAFLPEPYCDVSSGKVESGVARHSAALFLACVPCTC